MSEMGRELPLTTVRFAAKQIDLLPMAALGQYIVVHEVRLCANKRHSRLRIYRLKAAVHEL